MLEKDTNSGLNTFAYRHQQVMIANIYRQDFIKPGYTIQASFHYDKDDPSFQYDTDNFLVRPAPIGTGGAARHSRLLLRADRRRPFRHGSTSRTRFIRCWAPTISTRSPDGAWTSTRRWRRWNCRSIKTGCATGSSFFYASGDKNPRDGTARGFDTIFDNPNFAGGFFSFWDREGIRLTSTGVGLVSGDSLVPDLRTSKSEGQANFVNPGLFLYNAGVDIDITPKLRGFVNLNLLRFARYRSAGAAAVPIQHSRRDRSRFGDRRSPTGRRFRRTS